MTGFVNRIKCPACATEQRTLIFSKPFMIGPVSDFIRNKFNMDEVGDILKNESFTLAECLGCGLIYQVNILNDMLTEKLYDKWMNTDSTLDSSEYGGKKISLEIQGVHLQEAAKIVSFIGKPNHEIEVLDYGMGWGHWCLAAKALGCNVFGFDLSEVRSEYVRSNGVSTVDGKTLGGRKYDYINTEQVLEHVPDSLQMTQFLADALKPGGILKISVPDGSHIKEGMNAIRWDEDWHWRGFRRYLMPITPLMHINTFTPQCIRAMARSAGLKEVIIPLRHDYSLIPLTSIREAFRNTLRPIYRKLIPTTRLFFRRLSH